MSGSWRVVLSLDRLRWPILAFAFLWTVLHKLLLNFERSCLMFFLNDEPVGKPIWGDIQPRHASLGLGGKGAMS